MRREIVLLLLPSVASAESGMSLIGYALGAIGVASIAYTYSLHEKRRTLEKDIAAGTTRLERLKTEIKNAERILKENADKTKNLAREVDTIEALKKESTGARRGYWDSILKAGAEGPNEKQLQALLEEKARMESMIEMAKGKYRHGMIDDTALKAIVEEYQKKLIEVEARVNELEKKD